MLALMDRAMNTLASEQAQRGRGAFSNSIRPAVTFDGTGQSYAEIARLHNSTEGAVKVAVVRLREILRTEIAGTVATPQDVDDEIRRLFAAFR